MAAALLLGCGPTPVSEVDAYNFYQSIEASNEATRLTNRYISTQRTPTREEHEAILRQVRIALEHAGRVSRTGLRRMHDDMPRVYADRFRRGLETIARGIETRDAGQVAAGFADLDRWHDWLEANAHDIELPARPGRDD